jgi:outer membrane PBP1 activator LpoA protein
MTQDQANALVINADENTLQGWLDLQRMWFDNRNDPTLLKAGVKDWQTRYPQNPGAKMLPTALVNMQNYKPASINKIALFLPLNGQASIFGRTIQQGFEAAKNGAPSVTGSAVPAQVAQAANTSGNDDVVSPSQAEISDLTLPEVALNRCRPRRKLRQRRRLRRRQRPPRRRPPRPRSPSRSPPRPHSRSQWSPPPPIPLRN